MTSDPPCSPETVQALTEVTKIKARFDMHVKECDERNTIFREGIGQVNKKIDSAISDRTAQNRRMFIAIISTLVSVLLLVGAFLGQEVWRKTHPAETSSSHSVPEPRR